MSKFDNTWIIKIIESSDETKEEIDRVIRGDQSKQTEKGNCGPLLLGMKDAAQYLVPKPTAKANRR